MSNSDKVEASPLLKKLNNIIGGSTLCYKNFEDLRYGLDFIIMSYISGFFYINFEINNSTINNVQVSEKSKYNLVTSISNISTPITIPNSVNQITNSSITTNTIQNTTENKIKFLFKGSTKNKLLTKCKFKKKIIKEKDDQNEIWPLPDDVVLVTKSLTELPKMKAYPAYIIGNEIKYNFEIPRNFEFDTFDIEEGDIIFKIIENYPDFNITHLKLKPYWEVYCIIQASNNMKCSFGVLRLNVNQKELNQVPENDKYLCLIDFFKKYPGFKIGLKFYVLPYNYKQLFLILAKYEGVNKYNLKYFRNKWIVNL